MRVAIVEDSGFFRDALAESLRNEGVEITAEVETVQELFTAIAADEPDAVVLDICLPPTKTNEGLDAADALGKSHPHIGVVVLSAYLSPPHVSRLLAGGRPNVGCLAKDQMQDISLLITALKRVTSGTTYVDPDFVEHRIRLDAVTKRLTPAELGMLKAVAEGLSNQGIAERQNVHVKTVESTLTSVFRKLGIDSNEGNARVRAVLMFLSQPQSVLKPTK